MAHVVLYDLVTFTFDLSVMAFSQTVQLTNINLHFRARPDYVLDTAGQDLYSRSMPVLGSAIYNRASPD